MERNSWENNPSEDRAASTEKGHSRGRTGELGQEAVRINTGTGSGVSRGLVWSCIWVPARRGWGRKMNLSVNISHQTTYSWTWEKPKQRKQKDGSRWSIQARWPLESMWVLRTAAKVQSGQRAGLCELLSYRIILFKASEKDLCLLQL